MLGVGGSGGAVKPGGRGVVLGVRGSGGAVKPGGGVLGVWRCSEPGGGGGGG